MVEKIVNKIKVILVIDTLQFDYHKKLSYLLSENIPKRNEIGCFQIVDVAEQIPLHEKFNEIASAKPDLIVTVDLAGWQFRTELEGLSYNQLPARMAHLLFCPAYEYGELLKEPFTFSMFFYFLYKKDVEQIKSQYDNIPNVSLHENILEGLEYEKGAKTQALIEQIMIDTQLRV